MRASEGERGRNSIARIVSVCALDPNLSLEFTAATIARHESMKWFILTNRSIPRALLGNITILSQLA